MVIFLVRVYQSQGGSSSGEHKLNVWANSSSRGLETFNWIHEKFALLVVLDNKQPEDPQLIGIYPLATRNI